MRNSHSFFTLFFMVLCIVITSTESKSQELVRPVITGAPFLQIVPDARAGGLGEAGVATSSDAYSQFHNPAKYLFMESGARGMGLSYIPQFVGYANDIFLANVVYYEQLNNRSTLSGSMTYFNFGDVRIEEEMGNQVIHQGNFTPNEFAFDASYGLKLSQRFGMAVSARYIRSDITSVLMTSTGKLKVAHAVAADISAYYTSPLSSSFLDFYQEKWTAGFALKNIGSRLKYSVASDHGAPLPTLLKVGGAYHLSDRWRNQLSIYTEVSKFLVPASNNDRINPNEDPSGGVFSSITDAPDGASEEFKELILHLGTELRFRNEFTVRTGYITQHRDKGYRNHITFGVGLPWKRVVFNFAYQIPISGYLSLKQDKVLKFSLNVDLDTLYTEGL